MVPYFFLLLCWPTLPLQGKGLLHFGLTRTTKNDELETSRGESTFLFITNCCHYCVKSLAAARGRAVKFDPSNRPEADNLRVRLIMCCSPSRADAVHSQQSVRSCKTYLKTQTNKHLSELSCFCRPEKKKQRKSFSSPSAATVTDSGCLVLQVWRYLTRRKWSTFAPMLQPQWEAQSLWTAAPPCPPSSSGASPNRELRIT